MNAIFLVHSWFDTMKTTSTTIMGEYLILKNNYSGLPSDSAS